METITVAVHQPNWQPEAPEGQGNWCYAAVTRAVRGALLGAQLSQAEIVHNFYLTINSFGGATAAGIGGTRGAAIDAYADALGQERGAQPIPYDWVQTWIQDGQVAPDVVEHLSHAWGEVNLDGLTESSINSLSADDDSEGQVCRTIDAGGLVIVGTAMHCLVIYGYELDIEGDGDDAVVQERRFHVWDPTNGSSKVVPLGDYDGSRVTFVTR